VGFAWLDRQVKRFGARARLSTVRGRRSRPCCWPCVESLEFRLLLSGSYVVSTTIDSGPGSLRQAILDNNAHPGSSQGVISFAIGSGPQTITPLSPLPAITQPVDIDGTTQPGYAGAPLIELSGSKAGSADGLDFSAGNSVVSGLAIVLFSGNGINLGAGSGNEVIGNYIGLGIDGTTALSNADAGVVVSGTGETIAGNVISANLAAGIALEGGATGNVIEGNRIGTNAAGTENVGGGGAGVELFDALDNTLGGTAPGEGNLISGNIDGIAIEGTSAGNQVLGNAISSNDKDGVAIDTQGSNTIGGAAGGAGNAIFYNGHDGVDVIQGTGESSEDNAILGNNGLGIDLAGAAANNGQLSPAIWAATLGSDGSLTTTFSVAPAAGYPLTVDFFSADRLGQGKTLLGSTSYVSTNAAVPATVTFTPLTPVQEGDMIVATATDAGGDTSEFSIPAAVTAPPPAAVGDVAALYEVVDSSTSTPVASIPGVISAVLDLPGGHSQYLLRVEDYIGSPYPLPAGMNFVAAVDVHLQPFGNSSLGGATLTLTLYLPPNVTGPPAVLFYNSDPGHQRFETIVPVAGSYTQGSSRITFQLTLSSTPGLDDLTGTVFTIVVPATSVPQPAPAPANALASVPALIKTGNDAPAVTQPIPTTGFLTGGELSLSVIVSPDRSSASAASGGGDDSPETKDSGENGVVWWSLLNDVFFWFMKRMRGRAPGSSQAPIGPSGESGSNGPVRAAPPEGSSSGPADEDPGALLDMTPGDACFASFTISHDGGSPVDAASPAAAGLPAFRHTVPKHLDPALVLAVTLVGLCYEEKRVSQRRRQRGPGMGHD